MRCRPRRRRPGRSAAGCACPGLGVRPGRGGHPATDDVHQPAADDVRQPAGVDAGLRRPATSDRPRTGSRPGAEVFGWEPHGTGFRKCDGTYCWYRTLLISHWLLRKPKLVITRT